MPATDQERKFARLIQLSGGGCSKSLANSDLNGCNDHKGTFDAYFRFFREDENRTLVVRCAKSVVPNAPSHIN